MKKFITIVLLLAAAFGLLRGVIAQGATVTGNAVDSSGNPAIEYVQFKPKTEKAQKVTINGVERTIVAYPVRADVNRTNNLFSAFLVGGFYQAYFDGDNSPLKPQLILVPPDTNSYTFNQCLGFATNLVVFNWTNQPLAFLRAGTNIVFSTNGDYLVINSTASGGGSVTNGRDGTNGLNGYTPIFGVDYFNGTNGLNGRDGTNGINGTNVTVGVSTRIYHNTTMDLWTNGVWLAIIDRPTYPPLTITASTTNSVSYTYSNSTSLYCDAVIVQHTVGDSGGIFSRTNYISGEPDVVTQTESGLLMGTLYMFRTVGWSTNYGYGGESSWSYVTTPTIVPLPSTLTLAAHDTTSLTVQWNVYSGWPDFVTNADYIYLSVSPDNSNWGSEVQVAVDPNARSYQFTSLTPNHAYYFRMRGWNTVYGYGQYSDVFSSSTDALPDAENFSAYISTLYIPEGMTITLNGSSDLHDGNFDGTFTCSGGVFYGPSGSTMQIVAGAYWTISGPNSVTYTSDSLAGFGSWTGPSYIWFSDPSPDVMIPLTMRVFTWTDNTAGASTFTVHAVEDDTSNWPVADWTGTGSFAVVPLAYGYHLTWHLYNSNGEWGTLPTADGY